FKDFTVISESSDITVTRHGGRAKCMQRLLRLGMPVPKTVALSFDVVHRLAAGHVPDVAGILAEFGDAPLVSVRPSSEDPDWGGPGAILNIGMNDARHAELTKRLGEEAANAIYLRFIQGFAIHVARLDPDMFESDDISAESVRAALREYEDEFDEPFPQDPVQQLSEV
ncbi:pyruvate, phosphate dikinase, partial [Escherichia coli]|nr:pyruvate, phosphate dikinase [Escherichia coli]